MCKFLDFIPEHPRKLKRNCLSKSMKKAFSLKSIKNSINSDLEAKSDLEIFTGKFFFRFSFIRYPQDPSLFTGNAELKESRTLYVKVESILTHKTYKAFFNLSNLKLFRTLWNDWLKPPFPILGSCNKE